MSIEAMKMALKALQSLSFPFGYDTSKEDDAIRALSQAIQEEALRNVQRIGQEIEQEESLSKRLHDAGYTRREKLWKKDIEQDWSTQEAALESLREHMARIKELEAQIERMKSDKPVAYINPNKKCIEFAHKYVQWDVPTSFDAPLIPLYTHPQPKQEPVAYIRVSKTGNVMACAKTDDFYALPNGTLLYTHPQPKHEHVY